MKISIDYNTVMERHPEEAKKIVEKLRKGKSKHKNDDPSTLNWFYSYGIKIEGCSGADLMDMIAKGKIPEDPRPDNVDEIVADQLSRVCLCLSADKGRWWASGPGLEDYRPPEMIEQFKEQAQKELNERKRIENLSVEERQAEVNDCLKKLSKSSGFMAITTSPNI